MVQGVPGNLMFFGEIETLWGFILLSVVLVLIKKKLIKLIGFEFNSGEIRGLIKQNKRQEST